MKPVWLSLGCVQQHSSPHSIWRYTILSWQSALAAGTLYSYIAAVLEWQMNSLAFYVVDDKKGWTTALFSLRDAHYVPPQQCLSSSQHIHMVGLYSACVPSHIGPLWEYNSAVIMMVGSPHPTTPSNLYYYCHRRGQIWPRWPSDLSEAYVPRQRTATIHCDVCMCESCDISACIWIIFCDSYWPECVRQPTAVFGLNKPDLKWWKSS